MIGIKERINPSTPFKTFLSFATKDELAHALKYAGYRLSSKARKEDYIFNLDLLLDTSPASFLNGLCWDSLTVLDALVRGDSLFVKRPVGSFYRDVQKNLITVTYSDETNLTDYLAICPEVRKALSPVIASFLESKEAKLHRLLDPYIFGLTNLYGFCPFPLLVDYLKEFGLLGEVEGINIDEAAILKFIKTSFVCGPEIVNVEPGMLPMPYTGNKTSIYYLCCTSIELDDETINEFFQTLEISGAIFKTYRKFTEAEVVAAGHYVPEFIFPEALKLQGYLGRLGMTPEHITSEIGRYWLKKQSEEKFGFDSQELKSVCTAFLDAVPFWRSYGRVSNPPKEEFEDCMKDEMKFLNQKMQELDDLEKQDFGGFLPAITLHPAIRPKEGDICCSRLIPHNGAEITFKMNDGRFFVCYAVAEKGTERVSLYACWKRSFDVPLERFMYPYGIVLSMNFVNKYKLFSRLLQSSKENDIINNTRISLVSMEKQPKQWHVVNTIPDIDWTEVVLIGADIHPTLGLYIRDFYDTNMRLLREIEKSDSKSFKAAVRQMCETKEP